MTESQSIIPAERIAQQIILLRGQKVMLDSDLAELYGVGDTGAESGRQPQPGQVPRGLHVPANRRRGGALEVTICDFK